MNLDNFAKAYSDSFHAQIALFPSMMQPGIQEYIDKYSQEDEVMAWKMPGAGGGGYLALVVKNRDVFCEKYPDAIKLVIRKRGF